MYCPNCAEVLAGSVISCAKCGAEFGAYSTWKPQQERPRIMQQTEQSRVAKPSATNAVVPIVLFPLAGPAIGAVLFLSFLPGHLSPSHPAVFFFLVGAYGLTFLSALVAGTLYATTSLCLTAAFRLRTLSFPIAGMLGALSSLLGLLLGFRIQFGQQVDPISNGIAPLMFVGPICGFLLAIASQKFAPLGTQPSEAMEGARTSSLKNPGD